MFFKSLLFAQLLLELGQIKSPQLLHPCGTQMRSERIEQSWTNVARHGHTHLCAL